MRRPLADHHARLAAAGLDDLADGASTMEFLLRFILSHQDLHSMIVGSAQVAHVQANVAAAQKGPLPTDVYDALRDRLGAGRRLMSSAASVNDSFAAIQPAFGPCSPADRAGGTERRGPTISRSWRAFCEALPG
ncbi:hypothetical protein AB0C18_41020 [Nonomuraea muscovyensis]|uniref:hypothetical protein n=1 Tax=Nonomuraea muscovyensis TaxID=1124761 RepID=UPI0033F1B93D